MKKRDTKVGEGVILFDQTRLEKNRQVDYHISLKTKMFTSCIFSVMTHNVTNR